MNINQSTPNFQAKVPTRKLIPISSYNGPILKLTKSDQVEISHIQNKITGFEKELVDVKTELKRKGKLSDAYLKAFKDKIKSIEINIANLNKSIHDIKINRLNQQKQELNRLT